MNLWAAFGAKLSIRSTGTGSETECAEARVAAPDRAWQAVGCSMCKGTGYRGRLPIAEIFLADEAILRGIAERKGAADIGVMARRQGLQSMMHDGVTKVAEGLTSFEEVVAAIHG